MPRFKPDQLIGQSDAFLQVLHKVSQLAPLNKPVLIIGERGTGKELIAARLHYLSQRWDAHYQKLNCAALNENLLESELFGYEAGAFTGAKARRPGRFEMADQGTLFLDELANASMMIQEKLLRVIEYGEFERVGGSQTVKVDVRLLAATNENLPHLAEQGKFRSDLLDRLAFDVITLPPLRARRDDILLLAEQFAVKMTLELGLEMFAGFTQKARQTLLDYHWPGNVRELKNVVERAVYQHMNANLPVHHITLDPFASQFSPEIPSPSAPHEANISPVPILTAEAETQDNQAKMTKTVTLPVDFKTATDQFAIDLITQALAACQYNQRRTAESLQLTYHQLRGYMKKYQLFDKDKG